MITNTDEGGKQKPNDGIFSVSSLRACWCMWPGATANLFFDCRWRQCHTTDLYGCNLAANVRNVICILGKTQRGETALFTMDSIGPPIKTDSS